MINQDNKHARQISDFYNSTIGLPGPKRESLTRAYAAKLREQSFERRVDTILQGSLDEQLRDVPQDKRSYAKHPYPIMPIKLLAQEEMRLATRMPDFNYDKAVRKGCAELILITTLLCTGTCAITILADYLNK